MLVLIREPGTLAFVDSCLDALSSSTAYVDDDPLNSQHLVAAIRHGCQVIQAANGHRKPHLHPRASLFLTPCRILSAGE